MSQFALGFVGAGAAAVPPSVAASATTYQADGGSATLTANLPSGIVAGDLLLLLAACRVNSSTLTTPSGWTQVFTANDTVTLTGGRISGFYKIATGAEGSTEAVVSSATQAKSAIALRVVGASTTSAPEATTACTSGSGGPDTPGLTPSWGDLPALWISYFGTAYGTPDFTISAYPTNYTDNQIVVAPTASFKGDSVMSSRAFTAASDDPGAYTPSATIPWVGATIAIRP